MAVEPGLADQHLEPPPACRRDLGEALPHRLDAALRLLLGWERGLGDAGRRTIVAEDGAEAPGPLAGSDAGAGAGDRWLHDVASLAHRRLKRGEALARRFAVASAAPRLQARDLLALGGGVRHEKA